MICQGRPFCRARLAPPTRHNYFVVLLDGRDHYGCGMSLVRILVDGYSLLHEWPELAPGKPRHSAAARDALIQRLTHYQDAIGTPITVFFDGSGAPRGTPAEHSTPHLEVLFSGKGQTADDLIERAAYRFQEYGEVLAVTNDTAERNLVLHMGGLAESCSNFIQTLDATLAGLAEDVERHNREEHRRFRAPSVSRRKPHVQSRQ